MRYLTIYSLPPTSYVPTHFVDVEIVLAFYWARFRPHALASLKVLRRVWGREYEARHTQTRLSAPNIACCASNTPNLQRARADKYSSSSLYPMTCLPRVILPGRPSTLIALKSPHHDK